MSVWVTLETKVRDGQFVQLKPFLEANLPRVRGFAGALSVSLFHDAESGRFLIVEEWLSRAHHEDYIGVISANGVMAQLVAFMEAPPEVRYFSKLTL